MNMWHVARFTIKDLIRSKIMWNIPVLGILLLIITYVAREFTYGVPARVVTNFGMAALTISVYGISFFAGVTLIRSEAESRTVYLIFSRPVSRAQFMLGKISGVSVFLGINVIALSFISLAILYWVGGVINSQVMIAMGFVLLEAILLLVMIVFLSMISNLALTLIFGVILLVGGHAVSVTHDIVWLQQFELISTALDYYHWLLPAFYKLNFKNYAIYVLSFPFERLWGALAYWLSYTTALLIFSCVVIRGKDFD